MLKITNINKFYNKRRSNELHVLKGVSIEFPDKGLVALFGKSGGGKTTLLNVIGCLDSFNSGEVAVMGEKVKRGNSRKIRAEKVGCIFQNYNLIENLTVYDNIEAALKIYGVHNADEKLRLASAACEAVKIEKLLNRRVNTLSGGQKQRAAIARAIAKNPSLLVADEPTGNLDSENSINIMNILKEISKTRLVVLVTHERLLAEYYADRIIELRDGVIADDRPNTPSTESAEHYSTGNDIYLSDYEKTDGEGGGLTFYSDTPAAKPVITVLLKDNMLYVLDASVGSRKTNIIVNDGKFNVSAERRAVSEIESVKEGADKIDFLNAKKSRPKVSFRTVLRGIWGAFKGAFATKRFRKLTIFAFILFGIMTAYLMSGFLDIVIEESEFMNYDRNIIIVNIWSASEPEKLKAVMDGRGLEYTYADGSTDFRLDFGFSQLRDVGVRGSWCMPLHMEMFESSGGRLIAGKKPTDKFGIILDKMVADRILKDDLLRAMGVRRPADLVGCTLRTYNSPFGFVISGISDNATPSFYMDKNVLLNMKPYNYYNQNSVTGAGYSFMKDYTNLTAPPKKGEAYVVGSYTLEEASGTVTLWPNTDREEKYTVAGRFDYDYSTFPPIYPTIIINDADLTELETKGNHFFLMSKNPASDVEYLRQQGFNATHTYQQDKDYYTESMWLFFTTKLVFMLITLAASVIFLRYGIKISILEDIGTITVLRSLGASNFSVARRFVGKILIMTACTALVSYFFGVWVINGLADSVAYSWIPVSAISPLFALLGVVLILGLNLLFGLLPLYGKLAKTPYQLMTMYDH